MTTSRIVVFILFFILALGVYAGAYAAYVHDVILLPWFLVAFATLLIIAIASGVRHDLQEARMKKQDTAGKARLQKVLEPGQDTAYEKDEPLGPDDYKALHRMLWQSLRLMLIPIVAFTVIGYWLVYANIAVLICLIVLVYSLRNVQRIKRENVKTIIRGFVTDRFLVSGRRLEDSGPPDHFIQIGERKFLVNSTLYNQFKPGDMAEIHFINRATRFLGVKTHGYVILSARTIPYTVAENTTSQ